MAMEMTKDEALRELSLHLMQCGALMPIDWLTSHGDGSRFMMAYGMAMDALREKEEPRMNVYIAGKITGDPEYRKRFQRTAKRLEQMLGPVMNPAVLPEGMEKADYMAICIAMINQSDVVAFLPGWTASPGASLEHQYCTYIGKEILYLKEEET